MKLTWLSVVLLLGLILPAQVAMNARMRTFVLNPMYSSFVNFLVGGAACAVVMFVMIRLGHKGDWRAATEAPWWAWCGGLIGVLFVTIALLAIPRIGAANFTGAVIAGQLIGALLMDHYGLLYLPQHSISASRLGGIGLLLIGVWLIQRN